jgi:hypothetical protein
MYISILDYTNGKVIIHQVNNSIDAEDYVSDHFGLDNVEWMTTEELELDISIHKDI